MRIRVHALLSCWTCLLMVAFANAADPIKAIVGSHSVILPAGYHGLNYFPDEQISLLGKNPYRFLMVVGNSTVLLEGETSESVIPIKTVLAPGSKSDFDNGYAGITSICSDSKSQTLLGFYHAEDHVDMPKVPYNLEIQGAYWSIGLAVSNDNGNTFAKGGQILRSSVIKKDVTKEHQGIGDVHVITDASSRYFYAYYTDLTRRKNDLAARIGLARCPIEEGGKPGKWLKYHEGEFKENGLGGLESAVVNPPNAFPSEVIAPHVTYIPQWKKYLMVCNVVAYRDVETQNAQKGGIFYCHSDDGLKWTEPKVLIVGLPIPFQNREYVAHPTLVLETINPKKATGSLLYCYSRSWGTQAPSEPHHLAFRPITLTFHK